MCLRRPYPHPRRTRLRLGLPLLLLPLVPPAHAASQASIVTFDREARIDLPDGSRARIELPAGASLESACATGSGWIAAGTRAIGPGRELLLYGPGDAGPERLAAPGDQSRALRTQPRLLVAGGELRGLAWLEGTTADTLAVRAAERLGDAWSEPRWVSEVGPGTQTALTGAVLADGSFLLLWTGFDGEDDEVYASWHRGGWSAPERLGPDNRVPDILPALVATRHGALAAWDRYDGHDYRVVLARFAGGRWEEVPFDGEPGSVRPALVEEAGRVLLLYRKAAPRRSWMVLELDPEARVVGRAETFLEPEGERPRMRLLGGRVELVWPSGARAELSLGGEAEVAP